mmetsp:Transcript_62410/g.203695  ORF Transcript_62410/g.203695 Transcript_62410/m.203695 type:complete len:207 (-) Transcript_62410:892-1512(-)
MRPAACPRPRGPRHWRRRSQTHPPHPPPPRRRPRAWPAAPTPLASWPCANNNSSCAPPTRAPPNRATAVPGGDLPETLPHPPFSSDPSWPGTAPRGRAGGPASPIGAPTWPADLRLRPPCRPSCPCLACPCPPCPGPSRSHWPPPPRRPAPPVSGEHLRHRGRCHPRRAGSPLRTRPSSQDPPAPPANSSRSCPRASGPPRGRLPG